MKCIVKDCPNHSDQGKFIGDLCSPCFNYLTTGEGKYSQAYRNSQREWVSLTEDEIWVVEDNLNRHLREFPVNFARAIEAKLKEKNCD